VSDAGGRRHGGKRKQADAQTAGRAGPATVGMMRAAVLVAMIVVIAAVGHRQLMHMMIVSGGVHLGMLHGRNFAPDMR